jgi:hypothetical protein
VLAGRAAIQFAGDFREKSSGRCTGEGEAIHAVAAHAAACNGRPWPRAMLIFLNWLILWKDGPLA